MNGTQPHDDVEVVGLTEGGERLIGAAEAG